jgi:hypothetical protein
VVWLPRTRYDRWLPGSALLPCVPLRAADAAGAGQQGSAAGGGGQQGGLIGRRVCKWWPSDKRWFCGNITEWREMGGGPVAAGGGGATGAVLVLYDDQEYKWESRPAPEAAFADTALRWQPSRGESARLRHERQRRKRLSSAAASTGADPPPADGCRERNGERDGERDGV